MRADSLFNPVTEIEKLDAEPGGPPIINSYGYKSLHEQSHGESFFAVMMHRFGGHGFYVLDEPEAALSPSRQLAMISRIHQLVRMRSQFVIATHSPILMAYPNSRIYQIGANNPEQVSWRETEHYIVAKRFLKASSGVYSRRARSLADSWRTRPAEDRLVDSVYLDPLFFRIPRTDLRPPCRLQCTSS